MYITMNLIDVNLDKYSHKIFSQNGEDGVIEYLFSKIKPINKVSFEIGVNDHTVGKKIQCNTWFLKNWHKWTSFFVDGNFIHPYVLNTFVTKGNVVKIMNLMGVPEYFDLFSIDVDSNDFWILKEVLHFFSPTIVICEYNPHFQDYRIAPYDEDFIWGSKEVGSIDFYGVTLPVLCDMMIRRQYLLIYSNRVNAFFIKTDFLSTNVLMKFMQEGKKLHKYAKYHKESPKKYSKRWMIFEKNRNMNKVQDNPKYNQVIN